MSIEDILDAYKERSKKPDPEPAPEPSSGKLDGKTATKKVWAALKDKIDTLYENGKEEDDDVQPFMCLEWEFIGNYIFNMMSLASAMSESGDSLSGLAARDYKEAWQVLNTMGEDVPGIGCGDTDLLRKYGEYLEVEASVKSSVREEDILPTMHTLAKLMITELKGDFQNAADYRKGLKEDINPFTILFNNKKWSNENEAMEWAESKVEFLTALQSQLDTARGYLEGKSKYL